MNKKKWIIILIVVFIIPVIMMVYLVGCRQTRLESKLKKVLRDRYDEKFEVVDMYVLYGGLDSWPNKRYIATCRPVDNPDVVFEVDFWDYDIEDGRDNYFYRYVAKQVDYFLQEEFVKFFPDCYVHCQFTGVRKPQGEYIFNNKSLDVIMKECATDDNYEYIYLYINRDVGTLKKYNEEYEYFTKTIDEYADENKFGALDIKFYYVDETLFNEIKEFYKVHYEPNSTFDDKISSSNSMFVAFEKDEPAYIENEGGLEEYIRRREEFEGINE